MQEAMTMNALRFVCRKLRRLVSPLPLCVAVVTSTPGVTLGADLYPWTDHAKPYDFLFNAGAHIDTHQQSRLNNSTKDLSGFLYIQFTGVVSKDGYRVASHADCSAPEANCTVGWQFHGRRAAATFVYHVESDHPTWLVDRAAIPQPGSYSHFHWSDTADHPSLGSTHDGYLLQLEAADTFCFVHGDAAGFNSRLACEDDANDGVIVRPGTDIATHLNIVGSYPGYEAP
jgi:hypothetical protein